MVVINEKAHEIATAGWGAWHKPGLELSEIRAGMDQMLPDPPADVTVTEAEVGGVPGRWVETPESGSAVILYLHGGGGVLGSSFGYREMASRLARASRARVFVADYALAPENPFPAGFNDARAAYAALLREHAVNPTDLVVAGDSAGGGFALGLVADLQGSDLPLPSCVVAFAPFVDWTLASDSWTRLAGSDPLVSKENAENMFGLYVAGHNPSDPKVSPLFGDLSEFPPLLLQVADCEVLHDDSVRMAAAARAAGRQVELQVEDGLFHVHQMFAYAIPEAQESIDNAGDFIQRHVGA